MSNGRKKGHRQEIVFIRPIEKHGDIMGEWQVAIPGADNTWRILASLVVIDKVEIKRQNGERIMFNLPEPRMYHGPTDFSVTIL